MQKFFLPRFALLGSAAAFFVAACSSEGPVSRVAAPRSPSNDVGIAVASVVQACVDPSTSPIGTYSFSVVGSAPPYADVVTGSATVTLPGTPCVDVRTRADQSNLATSSATITASGPVPGTFTYSCVDNIADSDVLCPVPTSGPGNVVTASLSGPHGSTVTFTFVADRQIPTPLFVIGDNEPNGVGQTVNFWGAQWWKNNFMTGLVSNGVAAFKGYATSAANVCGGTWISLPGNSSVPPATIPSQIAVIVTSTVKKSGPNISGNIVKILLVNTNAGYGPNPGHAGTGVVASIACPTVED